MDSLFAFEQTTSHAQIIMTFLAICDKSELGKYLDDKPAFSDYKGKCSFIVLVTTLNKSAKPHWTMIEVHYFVFVGGVMLEHATFDNSRLGFHRRGRNIPMTLAEKKKIIGVSNFVLDNFHRMNNKLYFVTDTREVFMPRVNMRPLNLLHNPCWEYTNIDLRREMLLAFG